MALVPYKPDTDFKPLDPILVKKAYHRIKNDITNTPIITSQLLNHYLGHEFYFKCENFQKIGAFKARGATNKILSLTQRNELPNDIVAFSSGNHAQAVAWAAKKFHLPATICLPKTASAIKIQATKAQGANVILAEDRQSAEDITAQRQKEGAYLIHAYDDDDVLLGQGTCLYEALHDMSEKPNSIFVPLGGGGLFSGCVLAKKLLAPEAQIFAVEPENAHDGYYSWQHQKLYRFTTAPETIADGVKTLSLSPRTFYYTCQGDGVITVNEADICYWHQWICHLLKIHIEPTSALSLAASVQYLRQQQPKQKQKILLIVSGGNISHDTATHIWQKNYLDHIPSL